jgi:hypothetical protein
MIQQSTTLIGLTNPSTFHISNWSWIWRVATMDAQGPWIHDRLAPLSSQAQMAAAWPMMPHDAEQSHVAICHVHLSCAYTTTVPLLPRSKKALLRLGPSRQLCWHHSCLLAHRGKDLRSWLGAGETDRWRVKSWCRFVVMIWGHDLARWCSLRHWQPDYLQLTAWFSTIWAMNPSDSKRFWVESATFVLY